MTRNPTIGPHDYAVTADDRLWMHRAVQAETRSAEDRRRVAQALLNRFMMLRARKPDLYPTLAEYVRAYSQPVNPQWMVGGRKFERSLQGKSSGVREALTRTAQKRAAHASRTDFDASTVTAVERAILMGPVDLPRLNATDFGGPFRPTPSHLTRITEHAQGRNTYYAVKGSEWPGYIGAVERPAGPGIWVVIGALALGFAVRRRKP